MTCLELVAATAAGLAAEGLSEVIAAAWQGIERIRATWHLPDSFLRHCGLSVA